MAAIASVHIVRKEGALQAHAVTAKIRECSRASPAGLASKHIVRMEPCRHTHTHNQSKIETTGHEHSDVTARYRLEAPCGGGACSQRLAGAVQTPRRKPDAWVKTIYYGRTHLDGHDLNGHQRSKRLCE